MLQTSKYRCCFVYFAGFYSHLKNSENWPPGFKLTLEIPARFESRNRDSESRIQDSRHRKMGVSGAFFEKFRGPTKIFFWCSDGLGGSITSQKTLENCWGSLHYISRPLKNSKSGSQIHVFLPLGAMFGGPRHGPKISKVSFWHFYRPKTTHFYPYYL